MREEKKHFFEDLEWMTSTENDKIWTILDKFDNWVERNVEQQMSIVSINYSSRNQFVVLSQPIYFQDATRKSNDRILINGFIQRTFIL